MENLQFVVWYQDYRTRYFRHHKDACSTANADHKQLAFALPSAARVVQDILERTGSNSLPTSLAHDGSVSDASSGIPNQNNSFRYSRENSFRYECSRVSATFFKPGAEKELSLDSAMRDGVLRELSHSAHPDVVSLASSTLSFNVA